MHCSDNSFIEVYGGKVFGQIKQTAEISAGD